MNLERITNPTQKQNASMLSQLALDPNVCFRCSIVYDVVYAELYNLVFKSFTDFTLQPKATAHFVTHLIPGQRASAWA